ncbi:MAG TPA: flagellar protein FlaG [Pyrinomonadaceae bacterium]|nr:flagellar protein FlaG [Pyrinomonadaceae bacterium]
MRIESSMQVMAMQAVTRPQPIGQADEASAALRLQLPAFQGDSAGRTQERDIAEAVRALNKAAEPYDIALHFSEDEETGAIIIKMVNQETGELVHQIPDEAQLHLSAVLGKLQGQLFARDA